MSRVSRRASAEDTCKPTHSVEEGEENRHQCVRSSVEPTEHTQQQETNDEKEAKSKANSRQDKSRANSRQDKSRANSRQEKSIANSRQKKSKKTCEKPKAEHEESMKHTEDLHIQHKVNEELTKNSLKTRTGSFRSERM